MKSKSKQTKFPVARIKKIMQKDDDVGKVAQATPVLISKALEIFMQRLVDEAAKEARSKGSKKVAAYHLKRTVDQIDMFDFLRDIVAGVADPGDRADRPARGADGDEQPKKRRTRGPGKGKRKGKQLEEAEEGAVPAKEEEADADVKDEDMDEAEAGDD